MGSPPTHVWAATLADLHAKLSAGLKKSWPSGGMCPLCPPPLALDTLVVMGVIRNNEWPFSECINVLCVLEIFWDLAC